MGNGHSGEAFPDGVTREAKGRQSTRSLPDNSRLTRGKENEKDAQPKSGSTRRAKKIRTEKAAAAAESILANQRAAGAYYAPPGQYNPGPRSIDLGYAARHRPQPVQPSYSNIAAAPIPEDNWSDVASDVGYRNRSSKRRPGGSSSQRRRPPSSEVGRPTPTQIYFSQQRQERHHLDTSQRRSERDEMPPPPRPPKSTKPRVAPTVSAASIMTNETWVDGVPDSLRGASPNSTPTPSALRRELQAATSSHHSLSSHLSPHSSPLKGPFLSPSRSPECDKLSIQCLRRELEEERSLRLASERRVRHTEAALEQAQGKLKRYKHKLSQSLRENEESNYHAYGVQLDKIAEEVAQAKLKQEEAIRVNHTLREEKAELRASLEQSKAEIKQLRLQWVESEWKMRCQLAEAHTLHHSAFASPRTPRRSHTIEKGFSVASRGGSVGSEPSLPSGPSHSQESSPGYNSTAGAGEGLVSHPNSFADTASPCPPLCSFLNPTPPPMGAPPPRLPLFQPSALKMDEEETDEVKNFASNPATADIDNSDTSSIGRLRAGEPCDVSLLSRGLMSSLLGGLGDTALMSTPKGSPSQRNDDSCELAIASFLANSPLSAILDSLSRRSAKRDVDVDSHPISNSSSGVSSDPFRMASQAPSQQRGSLESVASLPFCRLRRSESAPLSPLAESLCVGRRSLSFGDVGTIPVVSAACCSPAPGPEPEEAEAVAGSPERLCEPTPEPSLEELEAGVDFDKSLNDSFSALAAVAASSPIRILQLDHSPLSLNASRTPQRLNASSAAERGRAILEAELRRSPPTPSSSESEEEGASTAREWDRQLKASGCGRIRYQPPAPKRSILGGRVWSRFGRAEKSALAKFGFLAEEGGETSSESSGAREAAESSADSSLFLSDLAALDRSLSSESSLSFTCAA